MDKLRLLGLIDGVDSRAHRLHVMELMGLMLLMMHWQRGIIDMLVQNRKTKKFTKAELENWNRVIENLETYEEFAWELAPSRAILPILRHFRLTGELPEHFQYLTQKDTHGRIPYKPANVDDIEEVIRRIKDVRSYEE